MPAGGWPGMAPGFRTPINEGDCVSSVLFRLACLSALLAAMSPMHAHSAPEPLQPDTALSAADRREVVDSLAQQLRQRYVFPDRAEKLATRLVARSRHGDYENAKTIEAFAEALSQDLREFGDDGHFRVDFDPEFDPVRDSEEHVPSAEEAVQRRAEMASWGYGISRVQRLPGNIGYLDLRGFGPTEMVGGAYDAAITLLAGTDALVLDLRSNGGGEPESVSYLLSHFFAEGDRRHLNDLYNRPSNKTREYWTTSFVPVRYLKPITVLTSKHTFSGGEECAYDLQTQKRATLIGETTGGGAHPGEGAALGHGLVAFVPSGRAINPVTRTNWEKVGVKPDIALPAAEAMKAAYLGLLQDRLKAVDKPQEQGALQEVLKRAQAGEIDLPGYTPPRR
jgi:hypothetical protein